MRDREFGRVHDLFRRPKEMFERREKGIALDRTFHQREIEV
jgi:hypothetical protein